VFVRFACCASRGSAWKCARDAEPADAAAWHPHQPHRCAHLRARLRIAGIAGVALSQIDMSVPSRPRLHHRQFHGVWCSAASAICGARWSAPSPSHRQQIPRALRRRRARKIAILVLIILFIQKRPRGMFALKGQGY